jgi:hypothetical protein
MANNKIKRDVHFSSLASPNSLFYGSVNLKFLTKIIVFITLFYKVNNIISSNLFSIIEFFFIMSIEMATSKQCSICNKLGPMHCTGCDEYFCSKDFKTHREGIFNEMDKIVEERNRLQDVINNTVQSNDQQNPVIEQINQWQNNIIEKVKQVAAQARQQAIQLLNSKRMKINTEFNDFSQELAHLKESEDYVEHDLRRLNQMISQFEQDLRQSTQQTTIEIHTEQSDEINWDSLIYVEEKETSTNNQQRQQQAASKLNSYFSWVIIHIVILFLNEKDCC